MQLTTQSAFPTATRCPPTVADMPLPGWLTKLPWSTSRLEAPAHESCMLSHCLCHALMLLVVSQHLGPPGLRCLLMDAAV